jgi:hypothetical protein
VDAQAHAILAVDFAHVEPRTPNLWVPEAMHVAVDLPVPRPRQTDMIRR